MPGLRRLVLVALVLVGAIVACGLGFVWVASDHVLRWGGYDAATRRCRSEREPPPSSRPAAVCLSWAEGTTLKAG